MPRPRKQIDPESVKALGALGATVDEVAAVLRIHPRTVQRRFAALLKEGKETGNVSLRRRQYQKAEEGNVTMLIWLGKQRLGQSDQIEQRVEKTITITQDERLKILWNEIERLNQSRWIKPEEQCLKISGPNGQSTSLKNLKD